MRPQNCPTKAADLQKWDKNLQSVHQAGVSTETSLGLQIIGWWKVQVRQSKEHEDDGAQNFISSVYIYFWILLNK